jgi:peptidyl-dipeptidase Dcp
MNRIVFILIMGIIGFTGCKKEVKSDNPFFNKWDTPFEVPPFEQIMAKHYMPTYLKGLEEQKAEIRSVITNTDEPTFKNTIRMLAYSGDLLSKAGGVFGALNSANTDVNTFEVARELHSVEKSLVSMHFFQTWGLYKL